MSEVCRLCLGTDKLVWIFDKRINCPEDMQEVIRSTTDVNIEQTDDITQKVCSKCCQITIRMFKFKNRALSITSQLKKNLSNGETKMNRSSNPVASTSEENVFPDTGDLDDSIVEIRKQYPKIILPNTCAKLNVLPKVVADKQDVVRWFSLRKEKRRIEKYMKRKRMEQDSDRLIKSAGLCELSTEHSNPEKLDSDTDMLFTENTVNTEDAEIDSVKSVSSSSRIFSSEPDNSAKRLKLSLSKRETLSPSISEALSSPNSETASSHKSETPFIPTGESISGEPLLLSHSNKITYICELCNKVQYSPKELRHHMRKHTVCQLCKINFRTVQEKTDHLEHSCEIKQIMNNLPKIILEKVDENPAIRLKYASAFGDDVQTEPEKLTEDACPKIMNINKSIPSTEILCISDDEDELSVRSNKSQKAKSPLQLTENVQLIQSQPQNPLNKQITCSAIIKPEIKLVGGILSGLEFHESDTNILKTILKQPYLQSKHQTTQTDLPCNDDISHSVSKDKLFEIKNLKKHLDTFKIPIKLLYGDHIAVSFKYNQNISQPKTKKDLRSHTPKTDIPYGSNSKISNAVQQTSNSIKQTSNAIKETCVNQPISTKTTASIISKPPTILNNTISRVLHTNSSSNPRYSLTNTKISTSTAVNVSNSTSQQSVSYSTNNVTQQTNVGGYVRLTPTTLRTVPIILNNIASSNMNSKNIGCINTCLGNRTNSQNTLPTYSNPLQRINNNIANLLASQEKTSESANHKTPSLQAQPKNNVISTSGAGMLPFYTVNVSTSNNTTVTGSIPSIIAPPSSTINTVLPQLNNTATILNSFATNQNYIPSTFVPLIAPNQHPSPTTNSTESTFKPLIRVKKVADLF